MESIQEFLKESLLTVDLGNVTKAELKQMYLKKQGIPKMSKEEKQLFSTAVLSAYTDFVKKEPSNSEEDISDNNTEINGSKSASENTSSDVADDHSCDSGLGVSHKESLEAVEVKLNGFNSTGDNETCVQGCESSEKDSTHFLNGSNGNNDSAVNLDEGGNGKPITDTSDELLLHEKDIIEKSEKKKEPVVDTNKKAKEKKEPLLNTSEESDDEPLLPKVDVNKSKEKKEKHVEESDDEPLVPKKKVTKSSVLNDFSSDSDDEPLIKSKTQKKDEKLLLSSKEVKQQKKSLSKVVKNSKKNVSSQPTNQKKSSGKIQKSFLDSSDSDESPLISLKAKNNRKNSLKNSGHEETKENNSPDNFNRKILSDSDNESFMPGKKRMRLSEPKSLSSYSGSIEHGASSSDSDEPLSSLKTKTQMKKSLSKPASELTNYEVENNKQSRESNQIKEKNSQENSDVSAEDADEDMLPTAKKTKFSNGLSDSNISDSDEEPLSSFTKNKTSIKKSPSKSKSIDEEGKTISHEVNTSDSDEEPLSNLAKKDEKLAAKPTNSVKRKKVESNSDESEAPIVKKSKTESDVKKVTQKSASASSDSEDEPLASIKSNVKKVESSSDESEAPIVKKSKTKSDVKKVTQKSASASSDSEDEPLASIKSNIEKVESNSDESESPIVKKSKSKSDVKKVTQKSASASSDSEDEPLASIKSKVEDKEDSSIDENEEIPIANLKSKSSTKVNKAKEQKKQTPSSGKLENLKKYIRAAGIHIKSYDKLFENCKSMKSKSEKLLHLLEKEGLKGRPTLAKCKKLKKKIETKKEVAELDPSNIISSGRPKRTACFDTTNCIDDDDSDVPLAKYSRLKGIIDSEESD